MICFRGSTPRLSQKKLRTPPEREGASEASLSGPTYRSREPRWISARFRLNAPVTSAFGRVGPHYLGYRVSCAATEAMTRLLAAELGPTGTRVVCIRSHAIPEASEIGSHSRDVFEPVARGAGVTLDEMLQGAASMRSPANLQTYLPKAFVVADPCRLNCNQ
ncbi:hypothetical protein A7A09_014195 [Paracoccus methylarcula]|uniref:Uncharacterized protein n=1 Tax=Paracoccus methylarcula TaxID=72022 RepID=A0A422QVR5_9RHOB|nr:hypothetical protein A7A09_014195 [Paracoccus methylarcula]